MHLTVIHAFTREVGDEAHVYVKGDKIFDDEAIKEILAGDNARSVVRTANGQKPN
jgi:hypothetical protein